MRGLNTITRIVGVLTTLGITGCSTISNENLGRMGSFLHGNSAASEKKEGIRALQEECRQANGIEEILKQIEKKYEVNCNNIK